MSQLQTQMRMRDRDMVPRFLVQAMFTLMVCALALVSFAVLSGRPHVGVPTASPVAEAVELRLQGDRAGAVTVLDDAGAVVARSTSDANGFIGVVWRVIARERMMQDAPPDAPVRVVRRENGRIAVLDTVTDWSIELVGYGPDNVAAFAKLID